MAEVYHVFDDRLLTENRIEEMKNEAEELLHRIEANRVSSESKVVSLYINIKLS